MLSRSLFVLAPTVIASVLGCQGPDITAELDMYRVLLDSINWNRCSCPELLGFDSRDECDQALGEVSESERQCVEDVLDGHGADARDFLACANTALLDYEQCLMANVDCEVDASDACASVYGVALGQCTQVPSDVRAAVTACTP